MSVYNLISAIRLRFYYGLRVYIHWVGYLVLKSYFVSQEAILSIGSSMTAVEFRDSVDRALHLAVSGIVSHTVHCPSSVHVCASDKDRVTHLYYTQGNYCHYLTTAV